VIRNDVLEEEMRNLLFIVLADLLLVCGCAFQSSTNLVNLDRARIIEIARYEIDAKCPTFDLSKYEPQRICYDCGMDPTDKHGTIRVVFSSIHPIKATSEALRGLKGPSYQTATISLSETGKIEKQNVGEWPEYPEWVYIIISEYTLLDVAHKEDTGEISTTNRPSDDADPFKQQEQKK